MSSVSLAGSLEDLGLNDILQILSLSRKSGILRMTSRDKGLDLFIRSGDVVAARPHPSISTLHRFFTDKRVLSDTQEQRFLQVLKQKSFRPETWTEFWAAEFEEDQDKLTRWAEGYMIWLVTRASQWNSGEFSFEMDPNESVYRKVIQVPVFPSDEEGLSAQFLAMEGARLHDESAASMEPDQRDVGDETITGSMPDEADDSVSRILVVDVKPDMADRLSGALRARGYGHVAVANSVAGAADVIGRANEDDWTIVCELVMPKRDRSGVLGGLEVAQELSGHEKVRDVYLCSDMINEEIETQGRDAGVKAFITKPARKDWKTEPDKALETFSQAVLTAIGPPIAPDPEPEQEEQPDSGFDISLDDPLAALMAEEDLHVKMPEPRTDRGMHLLRHMMEELTNPNAEAEVSLLILRFASDFFQRSVFFAVSESRLVGLGQVGLRSGDDSISVRDLQIELGQESVFDQVYETHRTFTGKPPDNPAHKMLFNRLGGPEPLEIVVSPVLAGGRIVAMLYADQVPTQTQIRDVETVEVFLAQAGLALERAFLLKQIREMNSRDAGA